MFLQHLVVCFGVGVFTGAILGFACLRFYPRGLQGLRLPFFLMLAFASAFAASRSFHLTIVTEDPINLTPDGPFRFYLVNLASVAFGVGSSLAIIAVAYFLRDRNRRK
jgi:uncharacterized membrane protein YfcA